MNNQRGEISLMASMVLWISFLLLSLLIYRLELHHRHLKQKLKLDLCAKEVMGISETYWAQMSQLNWGIDNATKVQVVAAVIPGLQGVSMKASKVKQALQRIQEARTVSYLIFLSNLKRKGCPTPLSFYKTPFEYNNFLFKRNKKGVAIMRDRQWNASFSLGKYFLAITYQMPELKTLHPKWTKKVSVNQAISL
jgi:hypothetical protein